MSRYIVTSDKFTGELEFEFNAQGWLIRFDLRADVNEEQHAYLMNHLAVYEAMIGKYQTDTSKVRKLTIDTSFDAFWKAYAKKEGRKRAEVLWEKLPQAERLKALSFIPVYNGKLAQEGTAKLYPENYIRRQKWNDQ